ncbi:aminotransferase-like domain-containing protein [Oligoflexus tunisiensis]|uniref:aminotransferase-like domain-containing protein n=1 Tax=Oligoflexus tunisiensis TaxID=708132 RepID=UPI00114D21CC|nr:PLP-dependent aminotransferase family protein [Oligoflexus tunisiensis]
MTDSSKAHTFLYERIAAELAEQIRMENLKLGEKLPSIRKVCRIYQVSLATAVQAFNLLERQQLIEARPQSGYYVRGPATLPELLDQDALKQTLREQLPSCKVVTAPFINEIVAAARDPFFVPLGTATPAPALLPLKSLQRSMMAAGRELGPESCLYELPSGNVELRRQIAQRASQSGCRTAADDIVITSGCMEALHVALASVAKPGDTIAVECPLFFGILDLIASLDLHIIHIPSHPDTGLDVEFLASVMQQNKIAAVLAIPNFNNPAGGLMPEARKKALLELVSSASIPLIEDDIYGELFHGELRPKPVKAYDSKGDVIYCSSFSKTLAPGLRLGWAIPGKYQSLFEKRKAVTTIASPTLAQYALAEYLQGDRYDRHLHQLRMKLKLQVQQYTKIILDHFPEGTRVSRPQGGFVLWVQLPEHGKAQILFERARSEKISVIPGSVFAAHKGMFESFVRISCGHPLNRVMEQAVIKLGRLVS